MRFRVGWVWLLAALALARPSLAEDAASDTWQVYVTPYLWLAGVTGTIKAASPRVPTQSVEAGFGSILSHLDAIPIMGAAELRYGRFGAMADLIAISVGAGLRTDGAPGSGGNVSLTQFIGTALASYRLVDESGQTLDVAVGVRAFGLTAKFSLDAGALPAVSRSLGASWADPLAAVRYQFTLSPRWGLTGYGDIGGGPNSDLTWQVLATVDYRPWDSTVMRAGFRYMRFQHDGGRLRQNMGMGGPILGATFRF